MTGTVVRKRKGSFWIAVAAALLASAGVAIWKLWPTDAPAVAVPDRVCANTLPGKLAADLLPKRGDQYWENVGPGDRFDVPYTGPTPDCTFASGDREVSVMYFQYVDVDRVKSIDEAKEKVEREAEGPGSAPLRLGEARGYASKRAAVLLLNCPMRENPRIIEARVYHRGSLPSDGLGAKKLAALASEVMRLAAKDVYKCDSDSALPAGEPTLGQPRGE
ncbi:hypothetical protein [Streptomyces sp. G45]|uniref:hypothetical protein n=1 Tax=Streptomyces sp. G45 TaxID=3406627 RepID=UPI003C234C04